MPRLLSIATLLAGLIAAGASTAAAQTTSPDPRSTPGPARPPLVATVSSCATGLAPDDRAVVFGGSMPQLDTSVSMAMRFELYERSGDSGPYARVNVPGFGRWQHSQDNVAGFVYDKRVEQLEAASAYRVTVVFRWYDAHGRVVRTSERTSPSCLQPDLRPNLSISRLLVGPARVDGSTVYSVTLRNTGRTAAAAPFATGLSVDGVAQPPQSLAALAPDGSATLNFAGPPCPAGASVVATADIGGTIDELDETDNSARTSCPAS